MYSSMSKLSLFFFFIIQGEVVHMQILEEDGQQHLIEASWQHQPEAATTQQGNSTSQKQDAMQQSKSMLHNLLT